MKRREINGLQLNDSDIDFINSLGESCLSNRIQECVSIKVDLWTSFRCRLAQNIEYDESTMIKVANIWNVRSNILPDYYIYYRQDLDTISGVLKYGEPTKVDYIFLHPRPIKNQEEICFENWVLNTRGEMCCIKLENLYKTKEEAHSFYMNNVLSKYKKDVEKILNKEDEKIEASKKLLKIISP